MQKIRIRNVLHVSGHDSILRIYVRIVDGGVIMNTIAIEGIPEGYEAVLVTLDPGSRSYHDETHIKNTATVILEKIKQCEGKETDIPLTNDDANVKIGVSQGDSDHDIAVKEEGV